MANTPQFSVRCPRALLLRIDEVHAEASRVEGYTRTDIIVMLLKEAFDARDKLSPKAKPRTPIRTNRAR